MSISATPNVGKHGRYEDHLSVTPTIGDTTIAVRPFMRNGLLLFGTMLMQAAATVLATHTEAYTILVASTCVVLAIFGLWSVENRLTLTQTTIMSETRILETRISRQWRWTEVLPLADLIDAKPERRWLVWHRLKICARDGRVFRVSVGGRNDTVAIANWLAEHIRKKGELEGDSVKIPASIARLVEMASSQPQRE